MPPIKAIEQAQFGGVDSRSNPVNMPLQRWIQCRNWRPRPDGHMELREGYVIRVYDQTGGGAAYSLTPYTVSVPDSYLNPPPPIPAYSPVTGIPPPISQVLPNGTRCALYWQKGIPSQATARIIKVTCSIQAAGVPELAIYQVDSTARFVVGSNVIVEGVVSSPGSPGNFFNGDFPIQAIGNGTITLDLGISPARKTPTPSPRLLPLPPPVRPPVHPPTPQAFFTVSPSSINFGNIPANTPTSASVTITYNNAVNVGTVDSASLSNASFTENLTTPVNLTNNQSVTFQVSINQALAGAYSAVLTITTLLPSTFTIPISANVVASSGGGGTPGTGNITVSPAQVVFPPTPVGAASSTQPAVVVTNNSGINVVFSNPVFSNPDFTLIPPGGLPLFPISVPNGGTFSFQLSVTPSAAGTDIGTLNITTDDAALPQLSISMQVQANVPGTTGYPENFAGSGGTMVAVIATPGPPQPLLLPLTTAGDNVLINAFPMKGMPILSTAPWHYSLGKDGYLYMHNGTDAKFFDGVCFRDTGLPTLTQSQFGPVRVSIAFSGPPAQGVSGVTVTWAPAPGEFFSATSYSFYYVFLNTVTNQIAPSSTPIGGGPISPPQDYSQVTFANLPSPPANTVGLIAVSTAGAVPPVGGIYTNAPGGAQFLLTVESGSLISMSGSGSTVTCTIVTGSVNWSLGHVVALSTANPVPWPSNGPFAVTVTGMSTFTFQTPAGVDASLYNNPVANVSVYQLLSIPPASAASLNIQNYYVLPYQGTQLNADGNVLLPYVDQMSKYLLPASAIGGTQPGYQFYACIYNPITGHVGNRVPIGIRINNPGEAIVSITGLPDFTQPSAEIQSSQDKGKIPTILLPTSDPEWRILIGRTGDGGEVPYAVIDSDGNWITTTAPNQTSINPLSPGQLDSNSELPFDNYPPPRSHVLPPTQESFALFWREGDRLCGVLKDSPFVYRSASELDSTTGIFVGDPAQAWDPSKIETFPSTEPVIGGFGNMQESWVFTRDELAQLSELSGQVAWNGPYNNFGIIGPWAFDNGWMALPFWVSHSRELCTMMPDGNGPIVISTEYERGLLSRIGDEFDAAGNPLGYMDKTQVDYFRDPDRMLEVLRIKCIDNNGNPFTVIHDFNLRDDASPYGQGYEETFLGPLAINYQQVFIRDSMALPRMWAAASDGQIYQFYSGGLDNVDYNDGTVGEAFIADAIALRYMGGERTVARTLEWYGDDKILWYIFENMLNVVPDQNYWVNLTFDMRPFPGDAQAAHYIADLQRPEMIHCYLWAQLTAHTVDAPNPADPMALSQPVPHVPLEQYGRLYLTAPWLGGSRGR